MFTNVSAGIYPGDATLALSGDKAMLRKPISTTGDLLEAQDTTMSWPEASLLPAWGYQDNKELVGRMP